MAPQHFYNAAAYAAPQGLRFGGSGRNSLRNPDYINFNMALFKHFSDRNNSFHCRLRENLNFLSLRFVPLLYSSPRGQSF